MESRADYRAGAETLARKLAEAGADSWQLLEWLRGADQAGWAGGTQAQLLARVFGEQFALVAGQPSPLAQEKEAVPVLLAGETALSSPPEEAVQAPAEPAPVETFKPAQPAAGAAEPNAVSAAAPEPGVPDAPPQRGCCIL